MMKILNKAVCSIILWVFTTFGVSAFDIGPFAINGFALGQLSYATNQCPDCQIFPDEDRQRLWADDLDRNAEYGPEVVTFSLFQPYLILKPIDLGAGFKVSAMLSQRWRDGKVDIPGIYYEMNATLSHEYYGFIQYGAFPTRGWGIADFPYGSLVGVADPWGASGAGYGLLKNALRIGGPPIGLFGGDLRPEITYDPGDSRYDQNQAFWEIYFQYLRKALVLDFIHQDAKNGRPGSWTHGPFLGLTDDPSYDKTYYENEALPENRQKIWLLMGRYTFARKYELYFGYRRNYWSGTDAVIVGREDNKDLWNNMFNVDWNGTLNGVDNPGYPARSNDFMLGFRYLYSPEIIFSTGAVNLGKAETENPSERGQSNSMTLVSAGVGYAGLFPGLSFSVFASMVQYEKKSLAPLSMPSNSAFSGVDSRVHTSGHSVGTEIKYNF